MVVWVIRLIPMLCALGPGARNANSERADANPRPRDLTPRPCLGPNPGAEEAHSSKVEATQLKSEPQGEPTIGSTNAKSVDMFKV
jgi:hypothetical protein